MSISARFDKKIKSSLRQTASRLKTSKVKRKKPYELAEDLLDKRGSRRGDLSSRSEEILRKRFKKNHP